MIEQLEQALADADAGFVRHWIAEAGRHRRQLLAEVYPNLGGLYRLRVHVPDRPGVLAAITQALGAERINIEDLEMQHVSPDRGAALALVVSGEAGGAAGGRAARGPGLRRRRLGHPRGGRLRRVEPAAALVGDIAVPGVKGLCQRAALLAAIADGDKRDPRLRARRRYRRGARGRADARRRRERAEPGHDQDRGRRPARVAAARRPDRLPKRRHCAAPALRRTRRSGGALRSQRRRVALEPPARAHRHSAQADGRRGRDDRAARRR